jgi:hypothetical protein
MTTSGLTASRGVFEYQSWKVKPLALFNIKGADDKKR